MCPKCGSNSYCSTFVCYLGPDRNTCTCSTCGYKWITCEYETEYKKLHPTTANVRFRWLKAIFTQIAKATSYIRKRCTQFIRSKYYGN